jgi:hypothetical protein
MGIGESGARNSVADLEGTFHFGNGQFVAACDAWLAFAPSDTLNAPSAYFMAGIAALLGADRDRAATALAGLFGTGGRGPYAATNRRLLEAGLLALDGRHAEAIREIQALVADYERQGLPWRQALAGLVLASLVGSDDAGVRETAHGSRAIFARLGARPFVERVDAVLARSSRVTGEPARQDVRVSAQQP